MQRPKRALALLLVILFLFSTCKQADADAQAPEEGQAAQAPAAPAFEATVKDIHSTKRNGYVVRVRTSDHPDFQPNCRGVAYGIVVEVPHGTDWNGTDEFADRDGVVFRWDMNFTEPEAVLTYPFYFLPILREAGCDEPAAEPAFVRLERPVPKGA